MKRMPMMLLIACVLMVIVGVAVANDMTGVIAAINEKAGTMSLMCNKKSVYFECEAGALPENVKVDDRVKVQFNEVNGTKKAVKVVKVNTGC